MIQIILHVNKIRIIASCRLVFILYSVQHHITFFRRVKYSSCFDNIQIILHVNKFRIIASSILVFILYSVQHHIIFSGASNTLLVLTTCVIASLNKLALDPFSFSGSTTPCFRPVAYLQSLHNMH